MGASSYSGKGSSKPSSTTPKREESKKSPMLEMLSLLEEVEKCRENVDIKQKDLDLAKSNLEKAEQKVMAQLEKLDPATKARFRKMMGGLASTQPSDSNEER